jgi:hypothetical protein
LPGVEVFDQHALHNVLITIYTSGKPLLIPD